MSFGKRKFLSLLAAGAIGVAALVATAGIATAAPATSTNDTTAGPAAPAVIVLTQQDNGRTVRVAPGDYVVTDLGTSLNWSVHSTNPAVISRVLLTSGNDGVTVFQAHQDGTAGLVGLGRPVCSPGQACPQFIVLWRVNIVVTSPTPIVMPFGQ